MRQTPGKGEMERPQDVFTVDYAKQLSEAILHLNWKYLDALEKTAKDDAVERGYVSIRMTEIQRLWNRDVVLLCQEQMAHMSKMVNYFQKVATDAISCFPNPPLVLK